MTLILWVVFSAMIAIVAVGLAVPLVRRYDGQAGERDAVTSVLRDQLAEIDAQARSGSVPASEAEALRTEIKRRLLAENRALSIPARLLSDRTATRLAIGLGAVVALGATGVYAVRGRPDLTAAAPPGIIAAEVAGAAAGTGAPAVSAEAAGVAPIIAQLEARMAAQPGDPEGWRLLGWSYFQVQRFADSANAYARAVALNPRGEGYSSALGEALVQAANGIVTPAASQAFAAARALNPRDPRAQYFLAVLRYQRGDHKGAVDDWVRLLDEAPPGAPWAPQLRRFVEQTAAEAKIDLTGRLPVLAATPPVVAGAKATGPSAADVAKVAALPPTEQQAVIRGMVDQLAARLAASPRDADGWVRLIRARAVLGDTLGAKTALNDGRRAFSDEPAVQKSLSEAAATLGVS
ncbi:MAG: c-type cytochrome biogenesis protein CcmI [Janthinobacterium lividum]